MTTKTLILLMVLAVAGCTQTNGALTPKGPLEVIAQDVEYSDNVTGRYAHPAVAGEYPGVIMVHEWWGLNDNIKDMASTLASEGYHVLAVDLLGDVATTPDQARALTGKVDQQQALKNMEDAVRFLNEKEATKIGTVGWCFGGGQALQLSLAQPMDATVIYYGRLVTNESAVEPLKGPVLGIFGENDTSITVASVRAFEAALDARGIQNEIHIYPGVGHAFANPSGMSYAPRETKDAWEKTIAFLATTLK